MVKITKKADFERFYNANIDKIYRFVSFRVGQNKELAEDLVSEIFIKAFKNFSSYDENISHSAWIFTIAKNHLANHWRDNAKKSEVLIAETVTVDEENGEIMGEEQWLSVAIFKQKETQAKSEIYDMLAKLSPVDQELVTFHYLYGYSYLEIAEMKGKSETAVKVAVHRAVKTMRKKL